jgi:hypothetical protein
MMNFVLLHPEKGTTRPAARLMRFIGDYLYYRKMGHSRRMAWRLAGMTLPL